jgi:hypothetical protein
MALPRSGRFQVIGALASGLIVVAFCLLLLWHDPLLFWNDDYQISILPVFADVARSWSEGNFPLLSPYSWICSNLAGEFQYGTFSIFVNAAVVLIWKFPLTFPQQAAALSMTHLFVLAAGGYLLARGRNLSAPLAMMVALVCALNGWIICWGATNWFGALGAFAWLPWGWWGLERALDPSRGRWRFLWPAPFVYLLVTGGFPYTIGMLGLLTTWLALKSLAETRRLSSVLPMLFGMMLGLGLSAPAWLALFDYIRGSVRQTDPASTHFQWLLPFSALPGFILPSWTVKWADFSTRYVAHPAMELACGLVPPVALLAGLIGRCRALVRQIKWELTLLAITLALSMLPSASIFRWSFRWLPLVHLLLAICAAEAIQLLNKDRERASVFKIIFSRPSVLGLVLVTITTLVYLTIYQPDLKTLLFVTFTSAICLLWLFADAQKLRHRFRLLHSWAPAIVTFLSLLVLYLCISPNCGVPKYNLSQKLLSPAPLDPERLYLSIYLRPETIYGYPADSEPTGRIVRPGSTSLWAGLHFINGYSPIRAAGAARAFSSYVHGEIDPEAANYFLELQAGPDGELAKLGVDGIVVANEMQLVPQPISEWQLVHSEKEGRVYHRRGGTLERVRSVSALDSRPNEQFAPASVTLIEDSRNRVVADVAVVAGDRPALITFSRPYFRGYQARIDGTHLNVSSHRGLMPVVKIPPGTNGRLVLTYRPWWLVCGGGVSILCATIFMIASALALRRALDRSD